MRGLKKRVEGIKKSQSELNEELLYTETWLDKFMYNMDSVNIRIKEIQPRKAGLPVEPGGDKPHMSEEEFKVLLERLLRGSLEHLGDKISQRILDKLKELKSASGALREVRIKELKEAADSGLVDLSKLFREKIESNIEDIGVEEKEAKGIGESLEKLRKMREAKTDKDNNSGKPEQ